MNKSRVSIVLGSDSDLYIMKDSAQILEEFGVDYEIHVISAHRNPEGLTKYIKSSESKGVGIFIGAAGGAAHLPGIIAAQTNHPVIGVPIKAKSLEGLDSLLSIVQMPAGVPVATVAINGAKNAGLLAIQILALVDSALSKRLVEYKQKMKENVERKSEELQQLGIQKYLEKMSSESRSRSAGKK